MKSHPTTRPRSTRLFPWLTLAALSLGLAPAACSSEPEVETEPVVGCRTPADCGEGGVCKPDGTCSDGTCTSIADCGSGQFCASWGTCESACASCGNACQTTENCPEGQYCSGNVCQQECQPGTEGGVCGALICTTDGKCGARDTIVVPPGTGGSGEGGMGGGPDCIEVDVEFEPQIPNVVLLIDQSGSMGAGDGFGAAVEDAITAGTYTPWDCVDADTLESTEDWRWNVVRNVLLNPETGVVKPLENAVRFGMALYSSENGSAGGTCPVLTEVAVDFGTHQSMLDSFQCNTILDETPTRESLTATAQALVAADLDGPKIIVLATDGEPDNCTCNNWDQQAGEECTNSFTVQRDGIDMTPSEAEKYDVVLEAQRIHDELGITIEVINVSSPNNAALAAHLDDVAERGGAVGGVAIDGFDPSALTSAFQTIIDGVRSCAIDLDGEITAGKENTGVVMLDGTELEYNGPNGWIVNSPTQIELVGTACETIKSGDHDLDITFPCGAFEPVPVR